MNIIHKIELNGLKKGRIDNLLFKNVQESYPLGFLPDSLCSSATVQMDA